MGGATRAPLVRGLPEGSLSLDAFRLRVEQNLQNLPEYARAMPLVVCRAHDVDTMRIFSGEFATILKSEFAEPRASKFFERWTSQPITPGHPYNPTTGSVHPDRETLAATTAAE
jgi:thiaminase